METPPRRGGHMTAKESLERSYEGWKHNRFLLSLLQLQSLERSYEGWKPKRVGRDKTKFNVIQFKKILWGMETDYA